MSIMVTSEFFDKKNLAEETTTYGTSSEFFSIPFNGTTTTFEVSSEILSTFEEGK